MEVAFVAPELRRLDELTGEVLCCALFEDERPPLGVASLVDWRLGGALARQLVRGFATGRRGEVLLLPARGKLPFDKVLVFGLGPRAGFDEAVYRETLGAMLGTLEGLCARAAVVELPGRHAGAIDASRAAELLSELTAERPLHEAWTLVEPPDDQRRVAAHLGEERRRVRRADPG